MPILLARESVDQLPRMMVGARIAVFECQDDEIEHREAGLFTQSIHDEKVEVELEYAGIMPLLAAIRTLIDDEVVKVLMGRRVLPMVVLDIYQYGDTYGIHANVMTIGEAVAVAVGSCFAVDEEADETEEPTLDEDAETLADYTTRMSLAESARDDENQQS